MYKLAGFLQKNGYRWIRYLKVGRHLEVPNYRIKFLNKKKKKKKRYSSSSFLGHSNPPGHSPLPTPHPQIALPKVHKVEISITGNLFHPNMINEATSALVQTVKISHHCSLETPSPKIKSDSGSHRPARGRKKFKSLSERPVILLTENDNFARKRNTERLSKPRGIVKRFWFLFGFFRPPNRVKRRKRSLSARLTRSRSSEHRLEQLCELFALWFKN